MESLFADLDVEELDFDTTAEERNRRATRGNQSKASTKSKPPASSLPSPSPPSATRADVISNQNLDLELCYCDSGDESASHSEDDELEASSSSQAETSPKRRHYSQRLGRYIELGQCMVCGGEHHKRECPQWKRIGPNGELEKRHRRHLGGRVGLTQKSQRFVEWILSKWKVEELRQGGIIDVAGGQGRVSTELQLRYRIPCVVIDPRAIVFTDKQKRFLQFQLDHPDRFLPGTPELPTQKQMFFEDDFLDDPNNRAVWERARLIIGLHPDEATERIVRLSLQTKKDFAVLPCCVFPTKFSERRTRDGQPVLYYPDLCKYLEDLDPTIERDLVPIPGRDVVLFKRT